MPATKRSTRKPAKGTLSAAHKRALAEGRTMSATVDRYLAAVNTPKRRGRKVAQSTLAQRLEAGKVRARSTTGVAKLLAAQEVRDLEAKIVAEETTTGADVKRLESDFVRIAKKFSENRGIAYGAWRDAGVPAVVLTKAGIVRTRG